MKSLTLATMYLPPEAVRVYVKSVVGWMCMSFRCSNNNSSSVCFEWSAIINWKRKEDSVLKGLTWSTTAHIIPAIFAKCERKSIFRYNVVNNAKRCKGLNESKSISINMISRSHKNNIMAARGEKKKKPSKQ